MRRNYWMALAVAMLACLSGPSEAQTAPPQKTNLVLIVVDDLGWADLGCYGADLHRTPHIDALARRGVRFTQSYAASPVCSPTRASLHTGRHPARLHITIWREQAARGPMRGRGLVCPQARDHLPHAEITLAEVLRRAGYTTLHVGKWHLGTDLHAPETQGFDVNIGGTRWGAPPTFFYPYRGLFGARKEQFRYVPDLPFGSPGEYLTDRLTQEAIRLLEQVKDRPFFLHLAYHTVHTPIEAKPEVVQLYRQRLRPGMHHQNPTYAAMVHHLDENVGRLLAALERLGLRQRTAVVLISDNGGYVNHYRGQRVTNNHPLRSGKGSLYEGGIRIPTIVHWPGITPPGQVCHEPISTVDWFPTLLNLLGLKRPQGVELDGVDISPLLKDPQAKLERDTLYFHYPHFYPTTTPVSAIRQGRWKLLWYFADSRAELYDLASDPGERNNLAQAQPQRVEHLLGQLRRWWQQVGAELPRREKPATR